MTRQQEEGEPLTIVEESERVKEIRCFLCRQTQSGRTHDCARLSTHSLSAERIGSMFGEVGITYYLYPGEEEAMIRLGYCAVHRDVLSELFNRVNDAGGLITPGMLRQVLPE